MDVDHVAADEAAALYSEILRDLPAFWGERDVRSLHHPVWLRQLSPDALVVRDGGRLLAYLLGVVTTHGHAYVHVVAVRAEHRGQGLARALHEHFLAHAVRHGATTVEAITTPANTASIAAHRRLGFTAELVEDYSGPGQPRVLLRRTTTASGSGTTAGR